MPKLIPPTGAPCWFELSSTDPVAALAFHDALFGWGHVHNDMGEMGNYTFLRNANGTGVIAGLSQIGDVVGYDLKDNKRVPIPGELYYRGYKLTDLIDGFTREHNYGFEEVSYLLVFGHLPTRSQLDFFFVCHEESSAPPADCGYSAQSFDRNCRSARRGCADARIAPE